MAIANHVGAGDMEGICKAPEAAQQRDKGLSLSVGYAVADEHPGFSIEELVDLADKMMYDNKAAYDRDKQMEARRQRRF